MWWRLAFPLVLMFAPRVIPRVARTVRLVWKLIFDSRVPLLLRLLVPGSLVYFLTPFARLPYVGLARLYTGPPACRLDPPELGTPACGGGLCPLEG